MASSARSNILVSPVDYSEFVGLDTCCARSPVFGPTRADAGIIRNLRNYPRIWYGGYNGWNCHRRLIGLAAVAVI